MKKIILTLLSISLSLCGFSQLTLITPTASGGFENGAPFTFANNFWTAVNGAANQWALGTGTFNIGTRAAYIGNTTTFVGTNTAAINHLYRSGTGGTGIVIPAGATNVQLAFRYSQPVVDPGNDSFIVSLTSTLTPTPVAGTTVSPLHVRLYQNTATAYTGYTLLGPFDLTPYAGTSVRLVFTYVNNGAAPIGIPAVDSVSVIYCPAGTVTGSAAICQGASTVYTVSTTGGAWSSSNPAVATATGSAATTTVTGVSAGTATITYSIGTCYYTRAITVNPLPAAITGTMAVCMGNTTTLSDPTPGGTWVSGTPVVATIGTSSGLVSTVGTGTSNITYTITSTGCTATAQVTVNALPAPFTVTGGGSFCASGAGVPVGLNGSNSGINYTLYNGTSPVSTLAGTGSTLSYGLLTSAGTYTVRATNPVTGCTSSMSGSATITVAAPVTPSVTITAPGTTVCSGSLASYTANPTNGGTTPTYQWYINGVASATGITNSYLPTNGDIISVTLHAGGICAVPDSAVVTDTAVVTPFSTPTIAISVGPSNPSCQGSPVTFSATSTFGGTTPGYRWTKNGTNVATGSTYTYIPANGDIVYCMLTSTYVCRAVDTLNSSSITMTVQPSAALPVLNLSAVPGTNITPGATVTFTALISGGGAPVSYMWLINGSAVTGATSAVFVCSTLVNGDVVTCKVTNMDVCGKSTLKSVMISTGTTGITNTSIDGSIFTVMPNPNKGNFTVRGTTQSDREVSLKVSNVFGQTIYAKNTTAVNGILNEQIAIDNLPAGMYIVHIGSDTEQQSIHFVVTN